jgi:hypothetical protein
MIYLGILIGLIIGLPIGFIKWKKPPVVVEKYSRRGLLHKQYSVNDGSTGRKSTIECVFEVGELESTDTLSKIEVIDLKPNQSQYNTDYERKRLLGMVDKSWETSKDIHWITSAADKRNQKIDQLLG